MKKLERYNVKTPCAKCGDVSSRIDFCTGFPLFIGLDLLSCAKIIVRQGSPHLHRQCDRCGYKWLEATIDSSDFTTIRELGDT